MVRIHDRPFQKALEAELLCGVRYALAARRGSRRCSPTVRLNATTSPSCVADAIDLAPGTAPEGRTTSYGPAIIW